LSLYQSWEKDPEKADRAAIDAMLAKYKDAFQRLDLAQKRPRCVFAIGLGVDAPVPHAQVARNAVRILLMHASRSLDRDEVEPALGDIRKMLRLSRDLRPRGAFTCQLVSVAIDATVCMGGVKLFLAYPKLRAEHCDRLIQLLADHEALAIEPFSEGIKGDYVFSRWTLRTFSDRVKTTIDAEGHAVETKLDERGIRQEIGNLLSEDNLNRTDMATLLLTNPATLLKDRQSFDDCLKTMLAAKPTYADRVRQSKLLEKTHLDGRPPCLFKLLSPNYSEFALVASRDLVYLRTAQCLVALRRWQLTHTAPPTDLAEVCRAAKMPGVPVDPFSGSALKLAIIDGEPVVYSVGSDGLDDGGRKDAELGKKPSGDFVFRLPKR
jgi:hypothetical protein